MDVGKGGMEWRAADAPCAATQGSAPIEFTGDMAAPGQDHRRAGRGEVDSHASVVVAVGESSCRRVDIRVNGCDRAIYDRQGAGCLLSVCGASPGYLCWRIAGQWPWTQN